MVYKFLNFHFGFYYILTIEKIKSSDLFIYERKSTCTVNTKAVVSFIPRMNFTLPLIN